LPELRGALAVRLGPAGADAEFDGDRVSLAVYLAAVLHDAARDLTRLKPDPGPDPADLFTRFIAWTRRDPP
jgi:hypothetical protein